MTQSRHIQNILSYMAIRRIRYRVTYYLFQNESQSHMIIVNIRRHQIKT